MVSPLFAVTDPTRLMSRPARLSNVELAEALDRVLNRGAVLRGDVVISVADVDLLYLDLRVVLSSIDTAMAEGVRSPDEDAD